VSASALPPTTLAALAGGCVALVAASLVLARRLHRQERLAGRMRLVRQASAPPVLAEDSPPGWRGALVNAVAPIGETLARSGLLSGRTLGELRQTLQVAGFNGPRGLGVFVGVKLLLVVGLPVLAVLLPGVIGMHMPHGLMVAAGTAAVGLLAPDFIVRSLRKRYLQKLQRGLPDALDMLVICSEAGLSLETAIDRVAAEIHNPHQAIAQELILTGQEMRMNADRRSALLNLGARTGVDSLRRMAGTLVQSLQYGTPLAQALRSLAAEERHLLLTRFEARAARLPVLLTIPMIVFILPCVFLVVAGPAAVQVMQTVKF
jgi:tight adherence protein C